MEEKSPDFRSAKV